MERGLKTPVKPAGEDISVATTGKRPRTARYDEKLNAVLSASAALFASKGYERASIRDVSKATGMSLAGLYYYFSSNHSVLETQ